MSNRHECICGFDPCVCYGSSLTEIRRGVNNDIAKNFLRDRQRSHGDIDPVVVALISKGMFTPMIAAAIEYGIAIGRKQEKPDRRPTILADRAMSIDLFARALDLPNESIAEEIPEPTVGPGDRMERLELEELSAGNDSS